MWCCFMVIAACSVMTTATSCGHDGSTNSSYYSSSGGTVITRDLTGGLSVTTTTFPPDYTTAEVVVSVDSIPCPAITLTKDDSRFSLDSCPGSGRTCSLAFRYFPASDDCEPGGVYLLEGFLGAAEDDPNSGREYTNMELAAWDAEGNPLNPSFRPFGAPILVDWESRQDWAPGDPLNALGSWTYTVEYSAHDALLPAGCSLEKSVELTLTPAAPNMAPRVYHYVVTETGTGEEKIASVAAEEPAEPAAPPASIELHGNSSSGATWRLSFTELDALRDAQVQVSVAFARPTPVLPVSSSTEPRAGDYIIQQIDIAAGSAPVPLTVHLAKFFSRLTKPLAAAYKSLKPTVYIQVWVYLRKSVGIGATTTIPVISMPGSRPCKLRFDFNCDCAIFDPGLIRDLAAGIAAAGPPDPSDSYVFRVSFWGAEFWAHPVLTVREAVLPVSMISE